MWNNPKFKKTDFENGSLQIMSDEECLNINGESVGTCLFVGYSLIKLALKFII